MYYKTGGSPQRTYLQGAPPPVYNKLTFSFQQPTRFRQSPIPGQ